MAHAWYYGNSEPSTMAGLITERTTAESSAIYDQFNLYKNSSRVHTITRCKFVETSNLSDWRTFLPHTHISQSAEENVNRDQTIRLPHH